MTNAVARAPATTIPHPAADAAALLAANINPLTGLSTDYLNHFNEAIMLLEMLPSMPECAEDVAAWRPLDYRQHFLHSGLSQGALAIAAYEGADPGTRQAFDAICGSMESTVLAAQGAIAAAPPDAALAALAEPAAADLKRLAARANAVIHGHDAAGKAESFRESQAAIDAILAP